MCTRRCTRPLALQGRRCRRRGGGTRACLEPWHAACSRFLRSTIGKRIRFGAHARVDRRRKEMPSFGPEAMGALQVAMRFRKAREAVIASNIANRNVMLDENGQVNPYRRREAMFAVGDPNAATAPAHLLERSGAGRCHGRLSNHARGCRAGGRRQHHRHADRKRGQRHSQSLHIHTSHVASRPNQRAEIPKEIHPQNCGDMTVRPIGRALYATRVRGRRRTLHSCTAQSCRTCSRGSTEFTRFPSQSVSRSDNDRPSRLFGQPGTSTVAGTIQVSIRKRANRSRAVYFDQRRGAATGLRRSDHGRLGA